MQTYILQFALVYTPTYVHRQGPEEVRDYADFYRAYAAYQVVTAPAPAREYALPHTHTHTHETETKTETENTHTLTLSLSHTHTHTQLPAARSVGGPMQPTLPNLGDQLPPNLYPYSPAYYPAGGAKRVAVTINANGAGSQNSFNVQGPALMSVYLGGGGAGEGETGGGGDFTYPDGHTAVIVQHSHMYACTCICVYVHTYTHGRMYALYTHRWGPRPRTSETK